LAACVNTVLWVAAAVAVCICELAGRTLRRGWPTAAQLLRAARGHALSRLALVIGWVWLGWHVFAR
jgi:hypothetical protein